MKQFTIVFSSVEEIIQFVNQAGKCEFDIDVRYNHIIIDAKSIVGLMGIGVGKEVEIICHTEDISPEGLLVKSNAA